MSKTRLVICFCLLTLGLKAQDSVKTSIVNDRKVIVHTVVQGQTLFAIARKYNVSVADIKALNPSIAQLQTGAEIYVPANFDTNEDKPDSEAKETPEKVVGTDEGHSHQSHTVKSGETLYRISKLYNVPVARITEANNIGNKGLSVGQVLVIPQGAGPQNSIKENPATNQQVLGAESKVSSTTQPAKTEKKTSLSGYPAITETGIGKLDESLESDTYHVLHKSTKIGTLVMIKNKDNGLIAHAKVKGLFTGNEVIVLNKKVFEKLGGTTKNISVEVYYTPEE